jgi:hypothetical protein
VPASRTIRIRAGDVAATAVLNQTRTATAIWDALPLEARASRWGEPRAASAVTVFGKLDGDAGGFRAVRDGATVRVERVVPAGRAARERARGDGQWPPRCRPGRMQCHGLD